ncbi:hypothetical protein AMK27_38305 [Streptomyces sp. CB02009]|uniref:hypothetical protein n=1 Tax=Streptomyces sp. CB02009 TaxID=1703938 RepID=UPI00093F69CE|nr:hypothetical protein [Streptomyces sp. CB02009]OKJ48626.1 hypothetical protein AMK27_38305 [Streptomyces sp. CB02009]
METDEQAVTGDYADDARLPLLTAAEARDAVGYMRLLETLDLTPRGQAAGQLAADLARRLPAGRTGTDAATGSV